MTPLVFALLGVATGVGQASMLARGAKAPPGPLSFLLRFLLVGAALVYAAVSGFLLVAAAGWLSGYLLAVLAGYWRLR